jgi:hypothetical protein
VVVKGIDKASDKVIVAKLLELRPETEAKVIREFEALRSFRHERIAALHAAYKPSGKKRETQQNLGTDTDLPFYV